MLNAKYNELKGKKDSVEGKELLLSSDDTNVLDFHYKILNDRSNSYLNRIIFSFFSKRKDAKKVSDYLFEKYKVETDLQIACLVKNKANMRYFFYDEGTENSIKPEDEEEIELEEALDEFYELTEEEGSFIGFINKKNISVKFSYITYATYLIEISSEKYNGTYQKVADYDKCVMYITKFFENIDLLKMEDFAFDPKDED